MNLFKNNLKSQFIIGLIFFLFVGIIFIFSQVHAVDLIPEPKSIQYKEFDIHINNDWAIIVDINKQKYSSSATWLKEKLNDHNSLNLRIVNFSNVPSDKRIILGNPQDHSFIKSFLEKRGIELPSYIGEEGYILDVFNNERQEIIIAANAPNGVFYGVQTLLQLIQENNSLKGISVIDYPDHKIRAVNTSYLSYFNRKYPPKFTQGQKNKIDNLAMLKINTLCLGPDHKGNFFQESSEYIHPYKQMVEYCRKRFIEFIPTIGSLRSIRGFPFELLEGWWTRDEKFKFGRDDVAIAEKPFINLLENGDFKIDKNADAKSDGWAITGSAIIDSNEKDSDNNFLKIESGSVYVDLPVEPNKHYHVVTWAKGDGPVICLFARDGSAQTIYGQCDYTRSKIISWKKLGLILKTSENVSKIRIKIYGKGKIWIDNVKFYRIDGGLKNVIRTDTTDIQVTNLEKTKTYQEGVDYKINNGETNKIFDEGLKPFQIRRLSNGNIAPGEKVLISYDSVLYWSRSHWYNQPPCVSDDRLYTDYYYPAIDRVIEALHPKIINLSSDEIRGFNRDSRNKKRELSNARLFAEWLNKINRYVKSKDPQCRVMIWDDMVSPYHNGGVKNYQLGYGGSSGRMDEALEQNMIDKEVIMNIWWYGDSWLTAMFAATKYFKSRGFNYFGSPWYNSENIRSWSELLVDQPGALGGFDTNWGGRSASAPYAKPDQQFPVFADHFWNTRYKVIYFNSFEEDSDNNGIPDGWNYLCKLPVPKNLIRNSSFEQDLTHWMIEYGEPTIDSTVYHEGSKSMHFKSNISGGGTSIRTALIYIVPDTDYELSGWTRGNNVLQGNRRYHKLFLIGRFYDVNKKQIDTRFAEGDLSFDLGSYDWRLFKRMFHSPDNAAYYRINQLGLIGTAAGEAWIDNISFHKYESPVYSINGKDMQGKRYAGFPNRAVCVKGDSKILYSDFIQIKPNLRYVLSVYIKRHKLAGNEKPALRIAWYNSNKQYLSEENKIVEGVSRLHSCHEMNVISPGNASYARIYLQGRKRGNEYFWFDTICLKEENSLNVDQSLLSPKESAHIYHLKCGNETEKGAF